MDKNGDYAFLINEKKLVVLIETLGLAVIAFQ